MIAAFNEKVLPKIPNLRSAIIQNDANEANLIINEERTKVNGIIDFGDCLETCFVFEARPPPRMPPPPFAPLNGNNARVLVGITLKPFSADCHLHGLHDVGQGQPPRGRGQHLCRIHGARDSHSGEADLTAIAPTNSFFDVSLANLVHTAKCCLDAGTVRDATSPARRRKRISSTSLSAPASSSRLP